MMRSGLPWTKSEKKAMRGVFAAASAVLLIGMARNYLESEPIVEFPASAPLPDPNGFDVYVLAGQSIVRGRIDWSSQLDDNYADTDPSPVAKRNFLRRQEAWLAANQTAFTLFSQAQRLPCHYPRRVPRVATMVALGHIARAKVIEGQARRMRGDAMAALNCALDDIQMGNDVARGGGLLAYDYGSAYRGMGRKIMEDFDATINRLSGPEARRGIERLNSIEQHRVTAIDACRVQRWAAIRDFVQFSSQPGWRSSHNALEAEDAISTRQKMVNHAISRRQIVEQIQRSYDDTEKFLAAPYTTHDQPLPHFEDSFTAPFCMYNLDLRGHEARARVGLDLLLLRLALRAYRAERSLYPRTLADLRPAYLKTLPTDNFTAGQAYHYRIEGHSYRLWSVGPDGRDDGGLPIAEWRGARKHKPKSPDPVTWPGIQKGDWVAGVNR